MFSSTSCFCYSINPDVRSSSARVECILCGHNLLDALMWMYGRRVIQTLDSGMMKGRCRTWAFLSISLDASKVSTFKTKLLRTSLHMLDRTSPCLTSDLLHHLLLAARSDISGCRLLAQAGSG